jgi:colanic acid/amylovoran biosynthesis glycosyltransferase
MAFGQAGGQQSTGERLTRSAYLISKYPAVSHTFILREVLALREAGVVIETASINAAPALDKLTEIERSEALGTYYIKAQGAVGALKSAAWLLFQRPLALIKGIGKVISMGATDPKRLLLCFFYLIEAAILAHWMNKRGLTHLHVHFASQAATVALLASYLLPITLSMTVHGPDEFYEVTESFLAKKMARARFVICISFFAQSQLMKIAAAEDWHKFEVVRLGVDTAHFAPRSHPPDRHRFEVLCVGRLVSTKGQRILVEAIERLVGEARPVHLTLVGGGPSRAELEQIVRERQLSEHVTLAGAVNQDHIREYYAAADIFALASFAEGIPVVLMEAMASGIPCVATAINGIPELIRDGVDGLLVAPSDVAGMAAAIKRFMDDAALRHALGSAGRVRVQSAYELKTNTDQLVDVLRRQLATT